MKTRLHLVPRLRIPEALFSSPLHRPQTEASLVHLLLNPLKTGVNMNDVYIYIYIYITGINMNYAYIYS